MKIEKHLVALRFVFLVIFFIPSWGFSYPWPFQPTGTPHKVRQTIGSYRIGDRFHNGVDICPNSGLRTESVYAVVSGTATVSGSDKNRQVRIGNQCYLHVAAASGIVSGVTYCTATTTCIGNIFYVYGTPHVHFIEGPVGGPNNNPLFFLDNFVDTGIITVKNIQFYVDDRGLYLGTKTATGEILVKNKVDILADVYDKMSHGVSDDQGKVMPYKLGFTIRNLDKDILYDKFCDIPTIRFNKCPLNTNVRRIHKSNSTANPQIWVSNETLDGATPISSF
ncbi:MAG: hypothetical protein AAB267_08415 [Candidatus Desantisbacteria bacterium]